MQIVRSITPSIGPFNIQQECFIPASMPSGKPWPKITVVTPTYKRAGLLEETIRSVITQRYPNLEYIVMDGGEDDETRKVIKKYEQNIAYWELEADRGQSHALNKGMKRATGDILTWLNDDDTFEPDALYSIALAFDMHECDVVAGVVRLERDGEPQGHHMASCPSGPLNLQELLDLDGRWNAGRFFYQPEVAFTKEIWQRAGGTVQENLHYSMDYDLWVRFAALGARVAIIGTPISKFLVHDEQKTVGNAKSGFKTELQEYVARYKREHNVSVRPVRRGDSLPKVCFVSDNGLRYGAGIAQRRIGEALRTAGHEVHSIGLLNNKNCIDAPSDPTSVTRAVDCVRSLAPDVVILGNLHATNISPILAAKLASIYPTFLLTHDFWWINGHCPYPMAPEEEAHICEENCPRWYEYPKTRPARIQQLFHEKMALFENQTGVAIAAYSKWAAEQYGKKFREIKSNTQIYSMQLGIDTNLFYPRNKKSLRKKYRINDNKFQIIVSCTDISESRKGVHCLLEALQLLGRTDVGLLIVGRGRLPGSLSCVSVQYLGVVDNDETLAEYYACADLHISASSAETFGQTVLEASACGVPVIAMAGSGPDDIITNGYNGFLVSDKSPQTLSSLILKVMDDSNLQATLAFWAPILASNEFSYFRLYHSLFQMFEVSKVLDLLDSKTTIDFPAYAQKEVQDPFGSASNASRKKKKNVLHQLLYKVPLYQRYRESRRERRMRNRFMRD